MPQSTTGVIIRHVTGGQVEKIKQALPKDIQALWPEVTPPREGSDQVRATDSRD
jgi:hypothetical protein